MLKLKNDVFFAFFHFFARAETGAMPEAYPNGGTRHIRAEDCG
jgi:hypothetical protein